LKAKITDRNNAENDVRQFEDVLESWKKLLNSRVEENVLRKNNISQILKNNHGEISIDEIEEFQNQFIIEDEWIHILKMHINDLEKLLHGRMFEEGKIKESFDTKMRNLGFDIFNSTTRFRILQSAFDE
jgi:hypothetical protein